jgi:SAM-dependent methyltransferase
VNEGGSAGRHGPLWGARARDWAENEEGEVPTFQAGLDRLDIGAGDEVLEVGCGTGVFLGLAADRGASVHGIDAAENLVELARERVPEADVRVGDMQFLPHADDAFDAVCGFNSFFFAEDMVAALREAGRVAKPGAAVLIQVWGPPEKCDLSAVREAAVPLLEGGSPGPPPPLYEPGVLEEIAAKAGLEPREAFDVEYDIEHPDRETMLRRTLAPGVVVAAIKHSGEEAVAAAISEALEPYRLSDGSYRLRNEWHFLRCQSP